MSVKDIKQKYKDFKSIFLSEDEDDPLPNYEDWVKAKSPYIWRKKGDCYIEQSLHLRGAEEKV